MFIDGTDQILRAQRTCKTERRPGVEEILRIGGEAIPVIPAVVPEDEEMGEGQPQGN